MSKQTKQTKTSAVFDPFTGIDARAIHAGEPGTAGMVNFRLDKNGALVKREGYHRLTYIPESIRAVWTGKLYGEMQTLLLTESAVKRLEVTTGAVTTIGELPSYIQENCQFFFYRDRLYIIGNGSLYQVDEAAVTPIEPYVPLVGKDWPTTSTGEIYQPRNLLTKRARIHYLAEESPSIFLRTAYSVESIEALYVNDVLKAASEYQYDDTIQAIVIQGLAAGDRVRVHLTYAASSEGSEAEELLSCKRAEVFGNTENNRIFFWDGTKKNTFYTSRYVSEKDLEDSMVVSPASVPLYFPEHTARILGDGRHHVTGFVRQYDRLLVFTEEEAYMANTDLLNAEWFSAKPINPTTGCSVLGAYAIADNTPFTVFRNKIYRWTAETDEYNQCNAFDISDPVGTVVEKYVLKFAKLYFCQARRELLLYSTHWSDSLWIYQLDTKAWYHFSNVRAEFFFEANGKLFFYYENCIFDFDESYYDDIGADKTSKEIVAEFHSHILEYGTLEQKHFSGLSVRADCDGGTIKIQLLGNGIVGLQRAISSRDPHSLFCYRLSSGRFRYATISIIAEGTSRPTIHSLISEVR